MYIFCPAAFYIKRLVSIKSTFSQILDFSEVIIIIYTIHGLILHHGLMRALQTRRGKIKKLMSLNGQELQKMESLDFKLFVPIGRIGNQ